jgi:hypothetical protein
MLPQLRAFLVTTLIGAAAGARLKVDGTRLTYAGGPVFLSGERR